MTKGTFLRPDQNEDYIVCKECHRLMLKNQLSHSCYTETTRQKEIDPLEDVGPSDTKGFYGLQYSPTWIPVLRVGRLFYWFGAVPTCAALSLVSMLLYGPEFIATAGAKEHSTFPVLLCFSWFVVFTCICCLQCAYWLITFIPARMRRGWQKALQHTPWGQILRRENFYIGLHKCTYAMTVVVSTHCMFLVVAQQSLISEGRLSQNFGSMMGTCLFIHLIILVARLLAWSQDSWEDLFYLPAWDPQPAPTVESSQYEWELTANFDFWARLYGAVDLMMAIFAVAVTFGLSEFDSRTDKVWNFFTTFHPCVLIDHYPASLVGLFIIGLREVCGFAFNLMVFIYVYCKAGTIEMMWCTGTIVISQLLMCCIVNAFSAQLYTEADLGVTIANWHGLSDDDLVNVRQHTMSYCIWLMGSTLMFAFQFRLMYRFKIPFAGGSWFAKVAWHLFFVVGMIFTISMTAAMVVAITYMSMRWVDNPVSFLQVIIGFMFNYMEGKYLMLMVAPVQRRMFPPDLGVKIRLSTDPTRGKFGILGRSEVALSLVFWILAFLIFATYLMSDHLSTTSTLFPLAVGFREKPGVFLFAPCWFLCSMLLAYSIFVQVRESEAEGMSSFRILIMKIVGLWMVGSSLMCLFGTIPLWEKGSYVSLSLLFSFPVWFILAQGGTPRCSLYCAIYIVLAVLAITASRINNWPIYSSVIATCLLCILLQAYPFWFKNNRKKLYCHFEVIETHVVDKTVSNKKEYQPVELESSGAYSDPSSDASPVVAVEKTLSYRLTKKTDE